MITLIKYGALGGGEKYNANIMYIDGLSTTDTKPTGTFEGMPIPNASVYTEIDTGKQYRYDAAGATWYQSTAGGGGGGGGDIKAIYDLSTILDPEEGKTYDLDDLPVGRYRITTAAAAERVINAPFTNASYCIVCEKTSADAYMRQIVYRALSANDQDIVYVRHYRGTSSGVYQGWSEWYEYKGTAQGGTPGYMTDILGRGTAIPGGTQDAPVSLDKYTSVGTYYCSSTAIAQTVGNVPGTAGPFRLEVKHYIATSTVMQTLYKTTEPEKMYTRKKQSNAWTGWYVFTGTAL